MQHCQAAIPWPSAMETPTVWVRGLSRQPFWDCHQVRNIKTAIRLNVCLVDI